MNSGDIIFFRYNLNPISMLIRFGINLFHKTKCPYNHVGMILFIKEKWQIIESNEKNVNIQPFDERLKGKKYEIRRMHYLRTELINNAKKYEGIKYDYSGTFIHQAIKLATSAWFKLCFYITGNWYGNKGGIWLGHSQAFADKALYCSELVAKIINDCDPSQLSNWQQINPRDLYIRTKKIENE